jgi:dCTP diphosphatase
MPDQSTTVAELRRAMQAFVDERDWRQYHTPKNLAMSLAIEAAELMEHFQWTDGEESLVRSCDPARLQAIGEEMADVCCYLLSLANVLNIELSDAVAAKLVKNAAKYPAEVFRGRFERPAGDAPAPAQNG